MLMLTSNLVITMCIVELMKPTFISGLIGIQIDRGSYLIHAFSNLNITSFNAECGTVSAKEIY